MCFVPNSIIGNVNQRGVKRPATDSGRAGARRRTHPIQMLMRLALIDVFIVAAPSGLLCWVLPQTPAPRQRRGCRAEG